MDRQDARGVDPGRPIAGGRSPGGRHRGRARLDVLAAIAVGGMIGATGRRGIAEWLPPQPGRFPWATFWTNLSGSFVLGLVLVVMLERLPPSRYLRPFAATGVLGAFTTMSTYQVEAAVLMKDGHVLTGAVYVVGSLVAGLGLAWSGILTGRLIPTRRTEAR